MSNFGDTMISEVPSNPQLTLGNERKLFPFLDKIFLLNNLVENCFVSLIFEQSIDKGNFRSRISRDGG